MEQVNKNDGDNIEISSIDKIQSVDKKNNKKYDKKKNKLKTIFCIILSILLVPIIFVSGVMTIKSIINPDEPADFMGYIPIVIKSSDTEINTPVFKNNTLVLFEKINKDTELEVDDIICYWEEDEIYTQVIKEIKTTDDGTKYIVGNPDDGYNNKRINNEEDIIGLYKHHIGGIGAVISFAGTPLGTICVFGIPVCLFYLFVL